jgi:hypothetical protein
MTEHIIFEEMQSATVVIPSIFLKLEPFCIQSTFLCIADINQWEDEEKSPLCQYLAK